MLRERMVRNAACSWCAPAPQLPHPLAAGAAAPRTAHDNARALGSQHVGSSLLAATMPSARKLHADGVVCAGTHVCRRVLVASEVRAAVSSQAARTQHEAPLQHPRTALPCAHTYAQHSTVAERRRAAAWRLVQPRWHMPAQPSWLVAQHRLPPHSSCRLQRQMLALPKHRPPSAQSHDCGLHHP